MNISFSHFINNDIRLGNLHDSGWLAAIYKKYNFISLLDDDSKIKEIYLSPHDFFYNDLKNDNSINKSDKEKLLQLPHLLEFSKTVILYELFLNTNSENIKNNILNNESDMVVFSAFLNNKITLNNTIFNKIKHKNHFLFNLLKNNESDKTKEFLNFYTEEDYVYYFLQDTEKQFKKICDIHGFMNKCESDYFNDEKSEKKSHLYRLLNSSSNISKNLHNPKLLDFITDNKDLYDKYRTFNYKKIIFSSQIHERYKRIIFKNELNKLSKDLNSYLSKEEILAFFNSESFYNDLFFLDTWDAKKENIKIKKTLFTFDLFEEVKNKYLQHYCIEKISKFYDYSNKNIKSLKLLFNYTDLNLIDDKTKQKFILNSLMSNNKGKIELTNKYIPFHQYIDRAFIEKNVINNNSFLYNTYYFLLKEKNILNMFSETKLFNNDEKTLLTLILNGTSNKLNILFLLTERNKDLVLKRKDSILADLNNFLKKTDLRNSPNDTLITKNSGYYFLKNENISKEWNNIQFINDEESYKFLKNNWSEKTIELVRVLNYRFFSNKENLINLMNKDFIKKDIICLTKINLFYFLDSKDTSLINQQNLLIQEYSHTDKYSKLISAYNLWINEIKSCYTEKQPTLENLLINLRINQNSNNILGNRIEILNEINTLIFQEVEKLSIYNNVKISENSLLRKKRL